MSGLVLSRYEGEQIFIGPDVTVKVVKAQNGKARLFITAPRSVTVHREEIAQRIACAVPAEIGGEG